MADPTTASVISHWRSRFEGHLISREDSDYDGFRRIWNGMIDRRPAIIARCMTANDVRMAVKLARAERLPISIRSGGHGVAGNAVCEGGVMIDLSAMKDIRVDAGARHAVAAPGVLWGEFDRATQTHGLATTGGQVSHTGIAGLTLGGGLGYLMGKHGAACDNLLSLDVVTADGECMVASEEQNPDLFWAMRGAGGNFGIVTSFQYRVHPLPEVFAGMLLYSRDHAADVIGFHREFLKGSPDELDTTVGFFNSPDGVPLVAIVAVYAGGAADGEGILQPLRRFGRPIADLIRPMSYVEVQSMLDAAVPVGHRFYWKSNFVPDLQPGLVAQLQEGATTMPSPLSMILIFEMKGQIQRVPKAAMAFDHRDANFEMSIIAQWTESTADSENTRWAREVWTAAQPYVSAAVYTNHMTADEPIERVRDGYGKAKYEKLAVLKAKYDPDNFFHLNHNIAPQQP
jgi:FAD/FMN-containing dehydrogenase